jgi:hypothetical protein
MEISIVSFPQPIHGRLINTTNVSFLTYLQQHNMKTNEVTVDYNTHPNIYIEKIVSILVK